MPPVSANERLPARWGRNSLRTRVLAAILVWVAFGISGVWFSATRVFEKHLEEQYHEELSVHIRELAGLVRITPDGGAVMTRPLSDPRYLVPLSGFYWQVSVDGGQTLRSASMTRGALDRSVAHSARVLHLVEDGPTGPTITYGFVRPGPKGGQVHFLIATDQRLMQQVVASFTRELTLWLVTLAFALVATGLAIVVFGFQPFDRLASAIAALRAGNRTSLDGKFPSEITPLVDDLNDYIAHTADLVKRGRVEAGNLAHFLRTPLAVIIDEAERLQQRPETADSAEVLLQQSQLMAQQVEFRMARARTAAAAGVPGSSCKLAEVLPPIVSAMRRLYPNIEFSIERGTGSRDMVPIDPIDCAELLSNLLDNAGKWATSRVVVALGRSPSELVSVADDGPGIRPDQIGHAFEIGARFDTTRPGSGLGLAIARDIAQAYGLEVVLGEHAGEGSGLIASVTSQHAPAVSKSTPFA